MNLRKLSGLVLCLPLLAGAGAHADDKATKKEAAPAAEAVPAEAAADQPAAEAKPADKDKPVAKPAPAPGRRGAGLLRGQQPRPIRREAVEAVREGLGAALRAAGELEDGDVAPGEGPPERDRRPPPPADERYAPPGGFAPPPDGPPPADGPPPPPRRRGPPPREDEDSPPPPHRPGGHPGGPGQPPPPPPPGGGPRDHGPPPDPEMQKLNREEDELDRTARELSAHYRRATDAKLREQLREELADVVLQHFEVRQQRRQIELERLEAQLGRLREAISKRSSSREALIKQRMDQLLGEDQDLGF